jgi:hypothetical protein
MTRWNPCLLLLVLGATACSSEEPAVPVAEAPAIPAQVDAETLEKDAVPTSLAPSPVETQRKLKELGIDTDLATFMTQRNVDAASTDEDKVAVGTGVVIADMLLTVTQSDDATLTHQLAQVRNGMSALSGGEDILATIDELTEEVNAGGVNREDLLKELDELSGVIIPELEFNGQERVVPLIQAGSWLEGTFLVASASKAAGNLAACDQMLKLPEVVGFFKDYTAQKGEEGVGNVVYTHMSTTLARLQKLTEKAEPFTEAEVDEITTLTGGLLGVL